MNRLTLVAVLPLLLAACSKAPEPSARAVSAPAASTASAATQQASIAWVKPDGANVDAIFARAKADNKPVFLYWGAVWCPPCNQIKSTVFTRPDFIAKTKSFVPVYLDGDTPGAQKLGAQFKVRGYPTTILFTPDGKELTRLPGEVDGAQYMRLLQLGLTATQPIQQTLAAALAPEGAASKLGADAWNMLAYYAWDVDESQLLPAASRAESLAELAKRCPPEFADAATRLLLRAVVLAAQDKKPIPNAQASSASIEAVLADPERSRANADFLINYAPSLVAQLSQAGTPQRAQWVAAWNTALDRLAADQDLPAADQLGAVQAKVDLALLPLADKTVLPIPDDLRAQAQAAATKADAASAERSTRQALIPSAAHVLAEVGLLDASDAMLVAELPKAVSAYYHMLVLASNAKKRGDKVAALDWSQKAYDASIGPATRLQWGSSHVKRLIELAPHEGERIEKAASQVIAELDPAPETFYERNLRSLEKMAALLQQWDKAGQHSSSVKRLQTQLKGICAKLPPADPAHGACLGVFTNKVKSAG